MSFTGALSDDLLDRAEARARRPLDRAAIRRRAGELGVPFRAASADPAARELLGRLRSGARLDPRLAALLGDQLVAQPRADLPEELTDVGEWIGAGEVERGRALRGLLRLYGAIAQSREPVREPLPELRPRIRSGARRSAS